ncbi:MAG: ABC transporter ATP-binding protein [Elusimicrobiaceae bacterium]|nr:ABC transporter ATP-binding protein [Elusimicrobiaceae bacterium]
MPLEIKDYRFRHRPGAPWILDGINLRLQPGECAAVTGRNGSGKSTLVAAVCGLLPGFGQGETQGSITTQNPPPAAVLQNLDAQILTDSVLEEIGFFLKYSRPHGSKPTARDAVKTAGLTHAQERKVHLLSTGEKQRLACVCANAAAGAGLAVFDEPSAYLDDDGARRLCSMIKDLKARGLAVLVAGHEFARLDAVIDKSYKLNDGQLMPARLTDSGGFFRPEPPGCPDSTGLLAANIASRAADGTALVENFTLEIRRGRITGLTGPNGAGKSTLAGLLAGLKTPHAGALAIAGAACSRSDLARKVRLLPQNPYTQLLYKTAGENFDRARREAIKPCGRGFIELARALGAEHLAGRAVQNLSYGQAQRCALLCAMLAGPEFIILDEAVSCLDAEGIAAFHAALRLFCRDGGGALVISHLAKLTEAMSDRVYSIKQGILP